MSTFSFSGKVWLGGDSIAYQSIAVNMVYGEGFPVEGGRVDSVAYQMYVGTIPASASWSDFYASSNPPTLYRNPLYPLFVAGVYRLFSINPEALRIIQFLLLVMAGSLLPYISYRMTGPKGLLPGIFAYLLFLVVNHHYAFEVMTEALIITYIILLVLAQLVLKYRIRFLQAVCLGILLGLGPLLKNYFIPLFLFSAGYLLYSVLISKTISRKYGLTVLIASLLTIIPWTIYANYQIQTLDPELGFVFITTQGEDVLVSANNEYATDGEWHTEWQTDTGSYYNQKGLKRNTGFVRVALFYLNNPEFIAEIFPAKMIKGFMTTYAQLLFYLSVLVWVAVNLTKQLKNNRALSGLLFLLVFSLTLSCIFGNVAIFETIRWKVFYATHIYVLLCGLPVFCFYAFIKYHRRKQPNERKKQLFSLLLIANFLLLTIVFYGSERINGVIDFIFLLLAIQIQFGLLNQKQAEASFQPPQTAKSG